jgi:hypothetical protein
VQVYREGVALGRRDTAVETEPKSKSELKLGFTKKKFNVRR